MNDSSGQVKQVVSRIDAKLNRIRELVEERVARVEKARVDGEGDRKALRELEGLKRGRDEAIAGIDRLLNRLKGG